MNLHYENNELYAEGVRLADAADTLGSPLFVMSRAAVGEAWRALGSPFREAGVPAVLYFSAKTNPVPAFLLELKALGAGLEVVSEYELWLARRLGYSKILVNGTGKPPGLLGRALEAGVDLYVIESRAELEEVLAAGRHRPPVRPLPVALRICPGLPGGNPATSSGAKGASSRTGAILSSAGSRRTSGRAYNRSGRSKNLWPRSSGRWGRLRPSA
jgi:diaminopimelate decarboxylase